MHFRARLFTAELGGGVKRGGTRARSFPAGVESWRVCPGTQPYGTVTERRHASDGGGAPTGGATDEAPAAPPPRCAAPPPPPAIMADAAAAASAATSLAGGGGGGIAGTDGSHGTRGEEDWAASCAGAG